MINDPRKMQAAVERKKMLIAQGALYRLGCSESKNLVRANLHVDTLAKSAISHLAANAAGAFGNLLHLKNFSSGNVQAWLPLLLSTVSFASKRRTLIKPAIGGIVMLAAAGALVSFLSRKKNRPQAADADADKAEHHRQS